MWSTHSLPVFSGPLWLEVVAPDRVLFMGQVELAMRAKKMTDVKLWLLCSNIETILLYAKRSSDFFKNVIYKCVYKSYIFNLYVKRFGIK